MATSTSLKTLLAKNTAAAAPDLVRQDAKGLRCLACGHRCLIRPGRSGVCRVRFNRDDELRVPSGYVSGLQVDPIEKKPFYHAFPGRDALSFGMLGCSFHCPYCQNWVTSQTLFDDQAVSMPRFVTAKQLAELAVEHCAPAAVSTYNEPLITIEWSVEVFKEAKARGLVCGYVSNGNGTPEALAFLRPYLDLFKIDLKCFDDKHYRKLGGVLSNVLATIEQAAASGYWVEIVTLVVPGFNDSDEELSRIAAFIAGVSRNIPWHVTAFHPDYKMRDPRQTPVSALLQAYDIGKAAGLKFVYPGNVHGGVGDRENTFCPSCNALIIRRSGFYVEENRMKTPGKCPACNVTIPGVWEDGSPGRSDGNGIPRPV